MHCWRYYQIWNLANRSVSDLDNLYLIIKVQLQPSSKKLHEINRYHFNKTSARFIDLEEEEGTDRIQGRPS